MSDFAVVFATTVVRKLAGAVFSVDLNGDVTVAAGVVVPAAHASTHAAAGSDPILGPLSLQAGTTSAGSAPLKLASGPLMLTPEAGAIERLADKLYFTDSTATRRPIAIWSASGTADRIPFATTGGMLLDSANFTRDPTTGDVTLGDGANLVLSGANAVGEGCIVFTGAASAIYDSNVCRTDSTAKTLGFVCGPTAGFAGANGPFFGLRGNTFSAQANQRGNLFLYGGKPAAPGSLEGRVIFGTNDIERMFITYGGDVKIATGALYLVQNVLVLPKTQNYGIFVDTTTPTYAWKDLLGEIVVRGIGANDPDWAVFRDTIRQYRWTNGGMREVWNIFHIPHDYVMGSDVHLHVHWDQAVVDTGGPAGVPGNVKWYFDITYAKGHGTPGGAADPFNAIVTASVVQQGSTTQYGHLIAEVQVSNAGGDASHIDRARLEPDGLMKVRLYRDSGDAADTLNQDPFVGHLDLHFQTTNVGTKQKAPPFWV